MPDNVARRPPASWFSSWSVVPGFFFGLILTDLRPRVGLWLGIGAAVIAIGAFLWYRALRWLAWLALGLALGVAALYLLAWAQ